MKLQISVSAANRPSDAQVKRVYSFTERSGKKYVGCINYQPVKLSAKLPQALHFKTMLKLIDNPKIQWDFPIGKEADVGAHKRAAGKQPDTAKKAAAPAVKKPAAKKAEPKGDPKIAKILTDIGVDAEWAQNLSTRKRPSPAPFKNRAFEVDLDDDELPRLKRKFTAALGAPKRYKDSKTSQWTWPRGKTGYISLEKYRESHYLTIK